LRLTCQQSRLKVPRLTDDAPKQFAYRATVERSAVSLLQASNHIALAFGIATGQAGILFQRADFHGQTRAPVQESKQLAVYFIYFGAPMFDSHGGFILSEIHLTQNSRKASRDLSRLGVAAGSMKAFCTGV
jgi:hypothetical protein